MNKLSFIALFVLVLLAGFAIAEANGFISAEWRDSNGNNIAWTENESTYVGQTVTLFTETGLPEGTEVIFEIYECDFQPEPYHCPANSSRVQEIRTLNLGNEFRAIVDANGIAQYDWTITEEDYARGDMGAEPNRLEVFFKAFTANGAEFIDNREILLVWHIRHNFGDLTISDVRTNPSLPFKDKGDGENIEVSFESNHYPLNVSFELEDSRGTIKDTQEQTTVNDENNLPVTYSLPSDLKDGDYELFMNVFGPRGDVLRISLGSIEVDSSKSSGGSGRQRFEDDQTIIAKQNFNPIYVEQTDDSITLSTESSKTSSIKAINYLILIGLVLLIILILLVLLLKR